MMLKIKMSFLKEDNDQRKEKKKDLTKVAAPSFGVFI